jgi:hypothetical protein
LNRVKIGFFSLTHHSTTGDDRPYLRWHQLDHMPEQYQLPGLLLGQRWASTPGCRSVRAAEVGTWTSVEHVVLYLMGNPVDETLDEFFTLGRHLAELGRYSHALPSEYRGGLRLLETIAAPRVLVSAEVIPFRPHRGVYLIVEQPDGTMAQDGFIQRLHTDILPALVEVPGVAGVWTYATSPEIRRPMFSEGRYRFTVCYLDDEPATVGERLSEAVGHHWDVAPSQLVLAAPFESLIGSDVERFAPGGA